MNKEEIVSVFWIYLLSLGQENQNEQRRNCELLVGFHFSVLLTCIDIWLCFSNNFSNNILYPKEDKKQRILLYACRNCDHQEVADNNRVYRNEVQHSVTEFTQILQDVASDPTLPRTKSVRCSACGHGEAVFLQATSREEGFTLFYVCCNPNCGNRWRD
ncbi:DNA-directed RNA polymerases II, IV and V subunit 9A [Jatropha curcas]|uniref:DNA-directed RNA polymerases II, IV and V subunit 9A n=1 Tax=Jatropha curcas TaxID=180498 RepID=UPI00189626D8|nr:DNA-directed RNA polymerases II, IV and V subunit 9A [Jatropha curcas]